VNSINSEAQAGRLPDDERVGIGQPRRRSARRAGARVSRPAAGAQEATATPAGAPGTTCVRWAHRVLVHQAHYVGSLTNGRGLQGFLSDSGTGR
jgi:hypothetical protein